MLRIVLVSTSEHLADYLQDTGHLVTLLPSVHALPDVLPLLDKDFLLLDGDSGNEELPDALKAWRDLEPATPIPVVLLHDGKLTETRTQILVEAGVKQFLPFTGVCHSLASLFQDPSPLPSATVDPLETRQQLSFFRDLLHHSPDIIYFKDRQGRLLLVNRAHAMGHGKNPEELVGKVDFDLFPREEAEKMNADDQWVMETGKAVVDKIEHTTRPGGDKCWVSTTKIPRWDAGGRIIGLMGITRDITHRYQVEQALLLERKIKEEILSVSDIPVYVLSEDHRVIHWNPALARLTGIPAERVMGTRDHWKAFFPRGRLSLADCVLSGDMETARRIFPDLEPGTWLPGTLTFEGWFPNIGRQKRYLRFTASPLQGEAGQILGALETVQDLTEHKHLEEDLQRNVELLSEMALKDSLTGLYNHRYLMGRLLSEWKRAIRLKAPLSLVMLDIDFFKSFNDAYGHRFGDIILSDLGSLILSLCRENDIAIRYGGDEFIVILPDTESDGVQQFTNRLCQAVRGHTFIMEQKESLKISVSAGYATYPLAQVQDETDFLRAAEQAFHKAKDLGGNRAEAFTAGLQTPSLSVLNEQKVQTLKGKLSAMEKRMHHALMEFLAAFAKSLEGDLYYSRNHTENMVHTVSLLARQMNCSASETTNLIQAAAIYDIGKIAVSEKILKKKGPLTREERVLVQQHPQVAVEILKGIESLKHTIPAILYHHEHFDGSGYNYGLSGKQIPLAARILAVADAYHALASHRPFRKALAPDKILEILQQESGTHFDPEVVLSLVQIRSQLN